MSGQGVELANLAAARALVDAFVDAGVRHAVLCPGSRSGPLAIAIDERTELATFVHVDERSAAFFALGVARQSGKPALVVCTSGTAAANLLPAAAEAFLSEVPLLLLTADRPPEARDFAAHQTIRQPGLFSAHARMSMDLAPPGVDAPPANYYRASGAHAFGVAMGVARGPVHLNVPFREPLLPIPLPPREQAAARKLAVTGTTTLDDAELDALASRLAGIERGLLVCGPSTRTRETAPALAELARALGWPALVDPLSGLRSLEHTDFAIDAYDAALRSTTFRDAAEPHVVLRFGALPTSKPLQQALAAWPCPQLLFATPGTWPDPSWRASELFGCDTERAARGLARRVSPRRASSWKDLWSAASASARETLDAGLDRLPALFEGCVARELARRLPERAVFFVGNSMPIRDVDTFCARLPNGTSVLANRGASGIDGVLSTALGAACAAAQPTVLLLGDLSFLHDAGALQLAARLDVALLVVVINNDGGGIFHMLPAAGLGDTFERCFATPHGLSMAEGAPPGAQGRIEVRRADTAGALAAAVEDWKNKPRLLVVEVPCDRHEAVELRRSIVQQAALVAERVTEIVR